jgi:segregation and condensation protein B
MNDAATALPTDDTTDAPRPSMDQTLINRIVEAALLAANQPLTLVQLHGLFPLDEPAPEGEIERAIETLRGQCAGRGVELVEVASGFRYQVQADVHAWVARLWTERQTRYTRATLETLVLIAYRQPITRGEIEQIRGVAVNSNIIKALEEREWIRVVGHRDMPGKPELLGTTKTFLDYFGLKRLDELPPLSELKDFGELEPELQLDGPRTVDNISDLDAAGDATDAIPVGSVAAGPDMAEPELAERGSGSLSPGEKGPADTASGERDSDPLSVLSKTNDTGSHDDPDSPNNPPTDEDPALADEGDSTGARHE